MKNKAGVTDMKQQEEQDSIANRIGQKQKQERLDPGSSADATKEHGPFHRWWSDYQKKMRSAFQAAPLKLQVQIEP